MLRREVGRRFEETPQLIGFSQVLGASEYPPGDERTRKEGELIGVKWEETRRRRRERGA